MATWLAAHAEDGYAGFFREELDERPTPFTVRDGRVHWLD